MGDADLALLRSPHAIFARRQIHGEYGGAIVMCVVLADGFIVDCGSDGYAEERAKALAAAVNATGPEVFDFGRKPNG